MGITDVNRVKCAVYMMRGDAASWWEGAVRGVNLPTLTWTEFRRMFFAKYFTEDVRSRMIRECMSLYQGDKSVVEYITQFERGCRFVPLITNIAPEKLRQFIDGLRAAIKHDVRMLDVTTYEAAVSRALRSKEGRREMQREQQSKRQFQPGFQRASLQPPTKKQFTVSSKGPSQQKYQGQHPQQQQRGGAPKTGGVPLCPQCQRPHSSQCLIGSNVCYHSKEPGHVTYNCPRKRNTTGRVFVMQAEEADPDTYLITGRILVGENSTFALLDSEATYSFISLEFIRRICIKPEVDVTGYDVTMLSGQILTTTSICRGLDMDLQGRTIRADLVVLPLTGSVAVKLEEGDQFVFYASPSSEISPVISYARARKLLRRGCQGFLASVVTSAEPPASSLAEIEVVRDFSDVFPDDVAGIPPAREVEFNIELIPDTVPISKEEIQIFELEFYSGGHSSSLAVLVVHPNLRDRIKDGQPTDEELQRLRQRDEAKGSLLYAVIDGIITVQYNFPPPDGRAV
ncbi:uncharacterized protein [Henckelia pumila]|uniref:uncharacterized protein n=1 Tax=Henckelia pumila TaxID=405737 RepID=UPI003C6E4044